MAELSGTAGSFNFTGVISDCNFNIRSWSAEGAADTHEVTDFCDSGYKTFIPGLKGWTASAEGFVDGTNTFAFSDIGTSATLLLYTSDTTKYYTGTAILTSWSPAVAVDGVQTQSFAFQGSGILTTV